MEYSVKINEFEGPLDLLLHLIKESNIKIEDIKIDEITKQYLDYINKMEEMNLDIASEYLVMAAELIEMKSNNLLPKKEEKELVEEEDPKEELIRRLLEYESYKKLEENKEQIKNISMLIKVIGIELDLDLDISKKKIILKQLKEIVLKLNDILLDDNIENIVRTKKTGEENK